MLLSAARAEGSLVPSINYVLLPNNRPPSREATFLPTTQSRWLTPWQPGSRGSSRDAEVATPQTEQHRALRQIASNALDLPLVPAAQLDDVPVGVADEYRDVSGFAEANWPPV